MPWIFLIVAGLLEAGWAIGLKYTQGFTKLVPSVLTFAGIIVSMYLLALAARTLPIGTAYAVWVGIGTPPTLAEDVGTHHTNCRIVGNYDLLAEILSPQQAYQLAGRVFQSIVEV